MYEAARELTNAANPETPESIERNRQFIAATDTVLSRPHLAKIDAGFQVGLKKHGYEQPWYYDGSAPIKERIRSIRQLAIAVDALAAYDTTYMHTSYNVHGGHESGHLVTDEAGTAIAMIRTIEGFRHLFVLVSALLVDCSRRIIDQYRAGELEGFVSKYKVRWSEVISSTRDIEVQLQPRTL
ncbi:MAG: hypothetical protein HEQ38_03300 [Gemmatimonas sp.]|nr:hypothetical protein [Gemmatimonas sp.]